MILHHSLSLGTDSLHGLYEFQDGVTVSADETSASSAFSIKLFY